MKGAQQLQLLLLSLILLVLTGVNATVDSKAAAAAESFNKYHEVSIQFCTSWGYGNAFQDVRRFLETEYPELEGAVVGSNYPPPAINLMISTGIGYLQLGGIVFIAAGESICQALGVPLPALHGQMRQNAMQSLILLMVSNSISQSLLSTGAFEIYYDGKIVFSKLQENRVPNLQEIKKRMDEILSQ